MSGGSNNSRGVHRGLLCPICHERYTATNFMRLPAEWQKRAYGRAGEPPFQVDSPDGRERVLVTDTHQRACARRLGWTRVEVVP